MPELERCPTCDRWFDPAALDEVIHHAFSSCIDPDAEMPKTGIRGICVEEPPQG
jgi:hypothetical protein